MTELPCLCRAYRTASGRTTGCTESTSGTFAPGHDAKLKSFLIAAGVDSEKVIDAGDHEASAIKHAEMIGYGEQVADGVAKGIARKVAKDLGDLGNARDINKEW